MKFLTAISTPNLKPMPGNYFYRRKKAHFFQFSLKESRRKVKLIIDEVHGKNCMTSFYGMSMTRDKLNKLIHKWKTLIESMVEVKTADGYILRIFVIAFTSRLYHQKCKTSYASSMQVKAIRKKINDYISKEASAKKIESFVSWCMNESFSTELSGQCKMIHPIENPTISKVKVLKRPKIDGI